VDYSYIIIRSKRITLSKNGRTLPQLQMKSYYNSLLSLPIIDESNNTSVLNFIAPITNDELSEMIHDHQHIMNVD
jgi:hypothetical protein